MTLKAVSKRVCPCPAVLVVTCERRNVPACHKHLKAGMNPPGHDPCLPSTTHTPQGETVPYVICVERPAEEITATGAAAAAGSASGAATGSASEAGGVPSSGVRASSGGLADRAYHPEELRENVRLAIDTEYYLATQVRGVGGTRVNTGIHLCLKGGGGGQGSIRVSLWDSVSQGRGVCVVVGGGGGVSRASTGTHLPACHCPPSHPLACLHAPLPQFQAAFVCCCRPSSPTPACWPMLLPTLLAHTCLLASACCRPAARSTRWCPACVAP